jgi:hypothetical protein
MTIDWNNITEEEYNKLMKKRFKLENDLMQIILDFETGTDLRVAGVRMYGGNGFKRGVQADVPQRMLFGEYENE